MVEIITTINALTVTEELLAEMLKAGTTIFRINMSHTLIHSAKKVVKRIREISENINLPCQIMIDIPGPEVRISNMRTTHNLTAGTEKKIYFEPMKVDYYFSTSIKKENIAVGDSFYLQDGDFEGTVTEVNSKFLVLNINNSNILRVNCHFSIPGKTLHKVFMSPEDKEIVTETAELKPDFYALSFVHSAQDIHEFNEFYANLGCDHTPKILTKFETAKAMLNAKQIIAASDFLYIARGDLGIEVSIPALPSLQKYLSKLCNLNNKPYFVATQMMDSMVAKTSPTRAEISDVANAVFDGTQGVTLSGETAIGKFPIESITWMKKIIDANSQDIEDNLHGMI